MTDRELDAAVAEKVMGWTAERKPGLPHMWIPPGHFISGWRPSTDIATAWQVEERIAELGLIDEYCLHLNAIANAHWEGGERQPQRWQLVHALPEDRCRAALKAVEVEND
jgi:hypothetical protein